MQYCDICGENIHLEKIQKASTKMGRVLYFHPLCYYKREYAQIKKKNFRLKSKNTTLLESLKRRNSQLKLLGKEKFELSNKLKQWSDVYGKISSGKIKKEDRIPIEIYRGGKQ
jgi:hypothetical protein